ncbi:MAG TPA: helix-turn-helix transcriptional regulator [Solirubrobacterales bacterium]|nr:helix-turn-helix transcriptional regulator [Solirubrobacterales bacterium]
MSSRAQLRMKDARAALEFAAGLAECSDPRRLKDQLAGLVDLVGAEAMVLSSSQGWMGEASFELADPQIYSRELLRAVGREWREHPLITSDLVEPRERVLRLSDVEPEKRWQGGALFSDFYRPLGMGRELSAQIAWRPGASCCIAFHRGGSDFGEREATLLELLAPHLRAARARAVAASPCADRALDPAELAARLGVTSREAEVLALLAAGRANKQIATDLGISPHTVVRHLEHIYAKLDVHNRTEAARIALDR